MTTTAGPSSRATSPTLALGGLGEPWRAGADYGILLAALPIGGLILAGMAIGSGPLSQLGALAAILAGIVSPAAGLATLAFMAPLKPPAVIPAPGFNAVLVAAVLLGCVYRLPIDRPQMRWSAPLLLLLAFVLYVGAQQLPEMLAGYAGYEGHLVGYLFGQLLTGFGAVVAAAYVLSRRRPYPFLAVCLLSAAVAAILAIATAGDDVVGAPLAGLVAQSDDRSRAIGAFGNPNYFGQFQAMAITAAVGWMVWARSRVLRAMLAATIVLLGVGMALSLSRGAVIALLAGLCCVAFTRSRALGVAVLGVGVVAALVAYPLFIEWRLSILAGTPSGAAYEAMAQSDAGRLSAALAGPQLFLSSPIFGVGFGHYSIVAALVTGFPVAAHNWYINVLAEQGMVGTVLWLLLLVAVVLGLRSRPPIARTIGFGVLGAYAVGSLFLEPPNSFQTSALPLLAVVAALVSTWRVERADDLGPSESAGSLRPGLSPRGAV